MEDTQKFVDTVLSTAASPGVSCPEEKQACSPPSSTHPDNSLIPVSNLETTQGLCLSEEPAPDPVSIYLSQTPNLLSTFDFRAPACRGEFKRAEDYTRLLQRAQRESRLGAILASLPPSIEEGVKPDFKVEIKPGLAYPLNDVWSGLPEQVRAYLSTVKETTGLGIAYEPRGAHGKPRWHVFDMSEAQETSSKTPLPENKDPKKKTFSKIPWGSALAGVGMLGVLSFKKAPQDGAPKAPKGDFRGKSTLTPPTNEPVVNFSVGSAVAGTAIVVGVSLGLRKLFPDLKSEPLFFLNLASMYGINYMMHRAGFYPNYNWKTFTGQLPGMFSLGFIGSLLVDGASRMSGSTNFQFGSFGHELATFGLTLGVFYTLVGNETLAPLLTGGTRSFSGLSFTKAAGGAGVLGGIGQGMKVAGWFGIANLTLGLGKWAYFKASGDSKTPEGRLDDYVSDIIRQNHSTSSFLGKYVGALWDGFMGHIQDALIRGLCKFSREAESGRLIERQDIKGHLIDGSKEFATTVRPVVGRLIAASTRIDTNEIDWSRVEEGIREMYGQNPEGVRSVYKILEYTGYAATAAQEIKDAIGVDGFISDRSPLEQIAKVELQKLYDRNEKIQYTLLTSIGAMRVVGNQVYVRPYEDILWPDERDKFSKEQQERLEMERRARLEKEVIPLALETQFYREALDRFNEDATDPGI